MRIEQHWTAQLQNQQQRNATILGVNTILLALFGLGGFGESIPRWGTPASVLFAVAIGLLAVALVAGMFSLWPSVGIVDPCEPGGRWLSIEETFSVGPESPAIAYQQLASRVQHGLRKARHRTVLRRRRILMRIEIFAIGIALLALLASVVLRIVESEG